MNKKIKKVIFLILVVGIIGSFLFTHKVKADMIYNLLTDDNGITWQYGYNPETKELSVSFFESDSNITEIELPNKNYFIQKDDSINDVNTYSFTNWENHNLGTPNDNTHVVTSLDFTNFDVINGIKPLQNNDSIMNIALNPNGSIIGKDAFRELQINISNLDKVTDIDGGAFYRTTFSNSDILLPNLNSLGSGAFENSNITSLEINSPKLGISSFKNCKNLTSVKLLNNVKEIDKGAFEGDSNLSSFDFNNVKTVLSTAFKDCTSFNIDLKDTKIETIGDGAFWGTTGYISSITLPASVKTLGWGVFKNSGITGVNLKNVEIVGPESFEGCKNLETIDFTNVIEIQDRAFENCNISSVDLKNVQKIDFGAFASNHITNLYLPKSLSVMEEVSVWYNNPIKNVTIAYDTLSNRILSLWMLLDGLYSYSSNNNSTNTLENVTLVAPYSMNEEAVINSNYDIVRSYNHGYYSSSFEEAARTKDISEGNKYKNVIQTGYLNNLPSLDNILIGEGYEFLGACQFSTWTSNSIYKNGAPKQITLPSTLKGIGAGAFYHTYYSSEYNPIINLPDSLEYIGATAFLYSKNFINEIDLPNLKYMGYASFMFSGIKALTFNSKLEYIGYMPAFSFNDDLDNLTFDCDFFNIYDDAGKGKAFFNMFKFDLNISGTLKFTEKVKQNGIPDKFLLYKVSANVLDLEDADIVSLGEFVFYYSHMNTIKFPKTLEKIEKLGFFELYTDTIDLSNTKVSEIGDFAFLYSNVKNVILPDTVKKIGDCAFLQTNIISELNIPNSLEEIGPHAFVDFKHLPKVFDYPNLKTIGHEALIRSNVEEVVLHDKLTYLGEVAFMDTNLKKLVVDCDLYNIVQLETKNARYGQNFTNIFPVKYSNNLITYDSIQFTEKAVTQPTTDYGAFLGVKSNTFDIQNTNWTIEKNMFQDVEIGTLLLPKNIKNIGEYAFYNSRITNPLDIPDSVEEYGNYAFMSSTAILKNNLPANLKRIGNFALFDTIHSNDLIIPSGVTSIGESALSAQTDLNKYHRYSSIERNSVTFQNILNNEVTNNQAIFQLLLGNTINNLVFGENVTELPTEKINEGKTYGDSIPEFANMNIKKVTINNVHKIPDKAFAHCENLEEVDFLKDANLEEFGKNSFMHTPSLKNVKLRQGLNLKIKELAFLDSGLERISDEYSGLDIKNNNITLEGDFIFSYMPNLKEVQITSKLNNGVIPKGTFYSDKLLEEVILEDDVVELKQEAFGADDGLQTFVMYGDTKIYGKDKNQKITLESTEGINFYLDTEAEFTVKINDTTISKTDFIDNKYTYNNTGNIVIEVNGDVILDSVNNNNIYIRNINNDYLTISATANLYCYLLNEDCNDYTNTYKDIKDSYNSDLYYLDEVLYLDTNKTTVKLNEDKDEIVTDGLAVYALRRDGVILVSEEWGKMTDAKKYVDSGITIRDYNADTTEPKMKVFNTSRSLDKIDLNTNENFDELEYEIGEEDSETGRANIDLKYTNIIVNTQPNTHLKSKGNYADVVYSDGCGGESFANVIYTDVRLGETTPIFTGTPTREGYEFVGWDKDIDPIVGDDVVYTAIWKKINNSYPDPSHDPVLPEKSSIINPVTKRLFPFLILIITGVITYIMMKKKKSYS